jgi:hypothetical protein
MIFQSCCQIEFLVQISFVIITLAWQLGRIVQPFFLFGRRRGSCGSFKLVFPIVIRVGSITSLY